MASDKHQCTARLRNLTCRFRLSTATHYQRASGPVDERWVGEDPKAYYAWMRGDPVPMEEARRW